MQVFTSQHSASAVKLALLFARDGYLQHTSPVPAQPAINMIKNILYLDSKVHLFCCFSGLSGKQDFFGLQSLNRELHLLALRYLRAL